MTLSNLATFISIGLLVLLMIPIIYWFVLAIASIKPARQTKSQSYPNHRFVIAIPAHDEAPVITKTVARLKALDYPSDLFQIHIVADYCSDATATIARQAGAIVHERNSGLRSGKGAALSWLFSQILVDESSADAVVIFDADTIVDEKFLRLIDRRLQDGSRVVQGQHIIRNPQSGWFPALTWAMFMIDNRYQNLGRSNLGWSAKNMGDSICLEAGLLRQFGWGEGLTEDYHLRQKLLLSGVRIDYEPAAIGYGEAPRTWQQAKAQRARWLRGTTDASRQYPAQLFHQGLRRRDMMLLDGALQARLPSYSTLSVVAVSGFLLQLLTNLIIGPLFSSWVIVAWAFVALLLFIYPFPGLALERAPARAYFTMMTGPIFILWRTVLALKSRLGRKPVVWVRTAHGEQN